MASCPRSISAALISDITAERVRVAGADAWQGRPWPAKLIAAQRKLFAARDVLARLFYF